MEQVPAEEQKELENVMDSQNVNADSYSREYTQEEKARDAEMRKAYAGGTFPESELRQEKTADETLADVLYYAQDNSVFHLPERELTDEELLQIIDFQMGSGMGGSTRTSPVSTFIVVATRKNISCLLYTSRCV